MQLFVNTKETPIFNFTEEEINNKALYFDSLLDKIEFESSTISNIDSAETLDLEKPKKKR